MFRVLFLFGLEKVSTNERPALPESQAQNLDFTAFYVPILSTAVSGSLLDEGGFPLVMRNCFGVHRIWYEGDPVV